MGTKAIVTIVQQERSRVLGSNFTTQEGLCLSETFRFSVSTDLFSLDYFIFLYQSIQVFRVGEPLGLKSPLVGNVRY